MPLFENFPYTNFHDLNLDWILKIVKQFSDTMAGLDDKIAEIIKEQLDELNLEQIILETVTKYGLAINVVAPPNNLQPADPTGAAESTVTIQGCIDYANAQGGGVVFFPAGRYLTGSLTMKSNVALVGFDMYTSRLTLKGGASAPLLSGDVQNCFIGGLTFDGNSEVQVDDITNVALTCNNVGFDNVRFTGGYILADIIGSGGDIWADGLTFGTCVQNALVTMGTGDFRFTGMKFNDLSAVGGVNVIGINTNGGIYDFQSVATCTVCCDISGDDNIVHCKVENAGTAVQDNGEGNQIVSYGDMVKAVYENFSLNVSGDVNIGSETADVTVEGKNINVVGTDFKMGQSEPTTYRTPENLNLYYDSIPFKDPEGNIYNVIVEKDGAPPISGLNPEDFGAVGDGVTDDTNAFKNMFDYANENNIPVKFPQGKRYLVHNTENIRINTSTDFSNSTIVCPDNTITPIFNVIDENAESFILTEAVINKDRIADPRLYDKSFLLTSPLLLALRSGSGSEIYYEQCFITDETGYFINTNFLANIVAGNYTVSNCQNANKPKITIENVIIEYPESTNNNFACLFDIRRNNVDINNVTIIGNITNDNWTVGVVEAHETTNVNFNGIYGINPSGPSSGYMLGIYESSNISVSHMYAECILNTSWGSIGISSCANVEFDDVNVLRFDLHYFYQDRMVIRNSQFSYAVYGIGNGMLIFDTVTFFTLDSSRQGCVSKRNDVYGFEAGVVKFVNCKFNNSTYALYMGSPEPAQFSDPSVYGFKNLIYIIEDCLLGEELTGVCRAYISSRTEENSMYNNKIEIYAKNIKTGNEINTCFGGTTNFRLKKITLENCDFGTGTLVYWCDVVSIINCILNGSTINQPSVNNNIIHGCIFNNTGSVLIPGNAVVIGNIVKADFQLVFNGQDGQKANASGNIITADTQTNLTSWNSTK